LAEVYYYVPAEETENIVECGLKLSKWYDRVVNIDGQQKMCISALLNPKDDMEKFHNDSLKCVKLELLSKYCYVADKSIYLAGCDNSDIMNLYYKTLIPLEQYIFGTYRIPECLIFSTVIYGQISVLNKSLDSPVLYDNSEDLYLNNIIEGLKDEHERFNDAILYYFYDALEKKERFRKIECSDLNYVVFIDNLTDRFCIIERPDLSKS